MQIRFVYHSTIGLISLNRLDVFFITQDTYNHWNNKMASNNEELPMNLQKSLNKIILEENISSHSIETRVVPPDGGSFMGILREITIKGEKDGEDKQIELFVKTMKAGAELTIYSVTGVYETETTIHVKIFKMFNELQNEANIPMEERYNTPKSYQGVDSESIIMENLAKQGYSMCERQEVYPLKFAEMALQQLAKFHGMCFVIQAKRPEFFKTKVKALKQPYHYNSKDWNSFVGNLSKMAMTILEPEVREKIEEYLPTTFEKYSKYADDPTSVRTLVHGDFRANNVMMKLNDAKISKVMIIDFQQTFYGCPMIDFFYFIFSGTDKEFRRQHLTYLKNLYYDTMKKFLKHFGLNIEDYYSRQEFERIYKERLDYGLMISLWLVPVILADKGEIPDVTDVDLNKFTVKFNDIVNKRVRDAVDDFNAWGYL